MVIDSHHHFWNYDPVEYDWIDESMRRIRRSFLPADLKVEIDEVGIDAVVTVQARQTVEETDWLLQLASENDFIRAVVGWLPLAEDNINEVLDRYADAFKLKAVRHVVQGQPAGFLDVDAFNEGIRSLTSRNLAYDVLVFENQLEEAIRFVDRHPNQVFVLDHIAKPKIKNGLLQPWRDQIRELSKRENITCKISGVVTEADWGSWTESELRPYFDTVLEAFGPDRLMFGSDWPVCLIATGYKQWTELIRNYAAPLSAAEQSALMGGTAAKAYKLSD